MYNNHITLSQINIKKHCFDTFFFQISHPLHTHIGFKLKIEFFLNIITTYMTRINSSFDYKTSLHNNLMIKYDTQSIELNMNLFSRSGNNINMVNEYDYTDKPKSYNYLSFRN